MNRRSTRIAAAAVLGLLAAASGSSAQSLANRVGSAGDRAVQFSYKARPGVCGDGRTYISTAAGNFFGSYSSSNSEACQAGPVRVVLDLADRNVVALRTFVGTCLLRRLGGAAGDSGERGEVDDRELVVRHGGSTLVQRECHVLPARYPRDLVRDIPLRRVDAGSGLTLATPLHFT